MCSVSLLIKRNLNKKYVVLSVLFSLSVGLFKWKILLICFKRTNTAIKSVGRESQTNFKLLQICIHNATLPCVWYSGEMEYVRGGVKSTNKQEDVSMYSNDNGIQYNQESSDDEDQHFKRSSILRVNFTATVHFYIIYNTINRQTWVHPDLLKLEKKFAFLNEIFVCLLLVHSINLYLSRKLWYR